MSKLPKFEDWKAPWEKKGEEFDAETAKKYIYALERDKETLTTEKAQVSTERDELQTKVEEFETKDLDEVERLKRELEKAKAQPAEDSAAKLENARLRLALEHGLTVAQADRLRGNTPEELEADVEDLKALLGGGEKKRNEERDAPTGRFRTGNEDLDDDPDEWSDSPDTAAKLFT